MWEGRIGRATRLWRSSAVAGRCGGRRRGGIPAGSPRRGRADPPRAKYARCPPGSGRRSGCRPAPTPGTMAAACKLQLILSPVAKVLSPAHRVRKALIFSEKEKVVQSLIVDVRVSDSACE